MIPDDEGWDDFEDRVEEGFRRFVAEIYEKEAMEGEKK